MGRVAPRVAAVAAYPAQGFGPDGVTVAGGARGLQVGLSGGGVAGEQTPPAWQDAGAAGGRSDRRDDNAGTAMPATRPERCGAGVAALCQGLRQLRTGSVPLLRGRGLTENE